MTKVDVAVHALNRMLELGRPNYVRTARPQTGLGLLRPLCKSMQHAGKRSTTKLVQRLSNLGYDVMLVPKAA